VLFNSLEFLLFFVAFIGLWPLLRGRNSTRWAYLVLASCVFYGWWDWRFLFLLLGSGLVDFAAGLGMGRFPRQRRWFLGLSIAANVGSLALFKYLDFAVGNINALLAGAGLEAAIPYARLTLPIGISFYTFQSMSYTIDVYRGELKPTRNVLHFFAYLAMFPQLVAGPIVRARELLPQLTRPRVTTEADRWAGLQLVVLGYFKKVVIADNLAPVVNHAFAGGAPEPTGAYWWVVTVMFACQIYCDFSGYSDIARGLARWMGYAFPANFDHPYVATSFRDFWGRWHISLSTWFRDYVYIPLGGSRGGLMGGYGNLWMTMLVSGLWHGPAWTFVIWGAVHAGLLSLERVMRLPSRLAAVPGGPVIGWALTLLGVMGAWVFFRAESASQAFGILGQMFSSSALALESVRAHFHWRDLALVGLVALRQSWFFPSSREWLKERWLRVPRLEAVGQPALLAVLVWMCIYLRGPGHAFVYFQF
jgi:D-alanyl-lipoteichoic acid acyltransferase DltB (MBOAT superfamily)